VSVSDRWRPQFSARSGTDVARHKDASYRHSLARGRTALDRRLRTLARDSRGTQGLLYFTAVRDGECQQERRQSVLTSEIAE
jgi:hypothetical protein